MVIVQKFKKSKIYFFIWFFFFLQKIWLFLNIGFLTHKKLWIPLFCHLRILVFSQSSPVHPVSESRGGTFSVTDKPGRRMYLYIGIFSFYSKSFRECIYEEGGCECSSKYKEENCFNCFLGIQCNGLTGVTWLTELLDSHSKLP